MKMNNLCLLSALFAAAVGSLPAVQFEHTAACAVPGKFAGWPANNGVWSWGDEILVGFMFGDFLLQSSFHNMDFATEQHTLARSTDGGQTWTLEGPSNIISRVIIPPNGQGTVVNDTRTWSTTTNIHQFPQSTLEIGPSGNLTITARVNMDGVGADPSRLIMNGGTLTTTGDFKFPDNSGPAEIWLNAGTFTANNIEAYYDRDVKIYVGGGTLVVQSYYLSGNRQYDPAQWLNDGILVPQDGYGLVITNLGSGQARIEAVVSSGVIVDDTQTWSNNFNIAALADGTLRIAPAGKLTCTGRVDMDGLDGQTPSKLIMNGGTLTTQSIFTFPNTSGPAEIWLNAGTFTAANIQAFYDRDVKIYVGGGALVVQSNYLSGNPQYDPAQWLNDGILVPQDGYAIVLTDLGLGAVRIDASLSGSINFAHPDFALRCVEVGAEGFFYYSYDRGHTWNGPRDFGNLMDHPELQPYFHLTMRTDYIVNGPSDCMFFMSVRPGYETSGPPTPPWDTAFMARTTDGGQTFQFVSWMVPKDNPHRSVMPSTVRLSPTQLVSAIRRRAVPNDVCWIDLYASNNNGSTWSLRSIVTHEDDQNNGNPPALIQLDDGRLCCIYANRNGRSMYARFSTDQGVTWGVPLVFRNDFYPTEPMDNYGPDLGYPRLVKRPDGNLVAMYYWQTYDYFLQNISAIEATIFTIRDWACSNPLPGDTDGDCRVNLEDFANLASEWMDCGRFPASACF